MAQWTAVHGLQDNNPVNADTFNKPLFELTERTNYLYNRLRDFMSTDPFESVRLVDAPLATATHAGAPVVGDVVCLDAVTGFYVKALASMSLMDAFVADEKAIALGVLISKSGATGTVLLSGKLAMETAGTPWTLADLVESGETFETGRYYLSSTEPGKITAYPSGPMVYIGVYKAGDNAALGDYAIVMPQYRDTGESHVHRTFKINAQPAGQQILTEETPEGIHQILGFEPVLAVDPYTERAPRLTCFGSWTGSGSVQYTIWLSNSAGTDHTASGAPTTWDDAWLHWISNDPAEGQGKVQVRSFELPVGVGTHGMRVALENPTDSDWDQPMILLSYSGAPDKRTWVITAPDMTTGWLPCKYRQYFAQEAGTSPFSLLLMGGYADLTDRFSAAVNVVCAEIHEIDWTEPSYNVIAGATTVVGSRTYEYVLAGATATSGHVAVELRVTAAENCLSLVHAINATGDAGVTAVYDDTHTLWVVIGTPASTTVTHSDVTVAAASAGAGVVTHGAPAGSLLVYDAEQKSLVDNYGHAYWDIPQYWFPVTLLNGLTLMLIPYGADGSVATADQLLVGDTWAADVYNPAPGAKFMYSMGMHPGLSAYYPPIPARAAALELNGVALDSSEFFDNAAYLFAQDTIYWYFNGYAAVPWPADWVDSANTGAYETQQKMLVHFVRASIGNTGYVTSLRPKPGSPIKVTQCGTNDPATVGDLMLDLDLALQTFDAGLAGYNVVKSVSGNKLRRGPVVERILPGPGVTITQSAGAPPGQGTVTIGLASDSAYMGEFEEVALENAKQEMIGMFPYVKLLGWQAGSANVPSGFTAKFRVPHHVNDAYYKIVMYATMFGESTIPFEPDKAYSYAGLTFTYSVLPDVYPIGNRLPIANLQSSLIERSEPLIMAVPMGNVLLNPIYAAYDPMLLHNNPVSEGEDLPGQRLNVLGTPFPHDEGDLGVRPGSLVAIRISRSDLPASMQEGTAEYTGALGFINLRWMLVYDHSVS